MKSAIHRFTHFLLASLALFSLAAPLAASTVASVTDTTPGYYNSSIGNLINGTSSAFPVEGTDPSLDFPSAPSLAPAKPVMGDRLLKPQTLTSPNQVPEGLTKSDWSSIRAAYEAGRHAFQPIEGGWQARNPGQQWITKFDRRGFVAEPRGGGWSWGLELKGYGFPGAERAIGGVPAVKAEGQRLTYGWDAAVTEWFVNDTRGLEHGSLSESLCAGQN